ncbi:MAG: carbohydrate porin [Methylacidiphilales bacterium]|nr:carbohydrate porin [Candidatus Methylacidiphilales bacterium]
METSASPTATASANDQGWFMKWATQDYMLGDWDGYRAKLSKQYGIDFEFDYLGAVANNLSGGLKTGSVYEGGLLGAMDVDFGKLADFQGGHFHVSTLLIHGDPFSASYVGDVNRVSLLDLNHCFRLWEMWYEQKLLDDKFSLKFGLMGIDQDFIVPDLYDNLSSINFINQTFFFPTMAFNVFPRPFLPSEQHGLASIPFTSPGIRVRIDPTPQLYVQAGVYGGNPDQTYSGTAFNLDNQSGVLSYYELGYKLNMAPGDKGLPGSYKFGGYYQTGDFSDNNALEGLYGFPVNVTNYHDNYGLYVLGEQTLYQPVGNDDPAHKGLVAFVRGGYAPPDRNLYEWGADGGLVYRGLLPGRDYDTCGLAFSYLGVSSEVQNIQRTINQSFPGAFPAGDYEAVLEGDYKIQMTAWMTIQASVQEVFHPGARLTTQTPDATVLILQTGFRF